MIKDNKCARIHSIESFGTVDGPGVRYVIFLKGCPLRCQYCHNPDTWIMTDENVKTVDELIQDIKKYSVFIKPKGGVTVSGGEPFLQIDFLIELFKELKKQDIHTAVDTSGITFKENESNEKIDELMKYTDLVLLDIKQINDLKHQTLTGHTNKNILAFARYLSNKNIPVWIRHVLVPGITTDKEDLQELRTFLDTLNNIHKIEVIPYHTLGTYKWENIGLKYPLEQTNPPSKEQLTLAKTILCE
ncbi:pyruvate formate-lyase-activating protein [Haloplasma contractile]|uniref:Pyruvate formate-lyase-activating enzyme n=1 Tax=Haloplasma contractile SSD-17B TaxID=1033810 RepID=F7PT20_9MOLU|nr:pyruvate formate-lyase-activating protein [Haloplasma contractile]ERJ12568.1 cystine transport system ATP-binding protein [Haloplasma contractile SSD-17B]